MNGATIPPTVAVAWTTSDPVIAAPVTTTVPTDP
jgi:hypothetical protein